MATHASPTDCKPTIATDTQASNMNNLASPVSPLAREAASEGEASEMGLTDEPGKHPCASQPMKIYTRAQLLHLSKSPLVKPPSNMPELRDWFGENESNLSKRDSEPATRGNDRERRFRRDAEDGDTSTRSNFRPTLSQPSQMGNFKHHSLRSSDRDRDKDTDKDRERDARDKDGQDRLRHLSDKYDRDRLAMPPTGLKSRERDSAPHLAPSSTRSSGQGQAASTGSRRSEPRDAIKKKAGEASEDWRRGGDTRSGRDERPESTRRDRDERERPRSRARDNSRTRRDPSTARRDRDERDKPRERDDSRRDRERDFDRDDDDPRRWRDDGKREERMAARRAERSAELHRERERLRGKESTWDAANDRRWASIEERDGRSSKRVGGREKKTGGDDGNERRDRDRDRDRDREKEPAWMDTYIPACTSSGILGGKSSDGELDGIQAWKKEQKEKEQKELAVLPIAEAENCQEGSETQVTDVKLDEIQLFRLLMKREEEKKKADSSGPSLQLNSLPDKQDSHSPDPTDPAASTSTTGNALSLRAQSENRSMPGGAPHTLLSVLGSKESAPNTLGGSETITPSPRTVKPMSHENTPQTKQTVDRPVNDSGPPQGSRLLAFARAPSTAAKSQANNNSNGAIQNGSLQKIGVAGEPQQRLLSSDPVPGFSPFEDQRSLDSQKELTSFETLSRVPAEPLTLTVDHGALQETPSSVDGSSGFSAGKGSRFAKFFDAKPKDNGAPAAKLPVVGHMTSSSPGPTSHRQEVGGFNSLVGNTPDPRTLDEIYLMLNNSAQGNRAPNHSGHVSSSTALPGIGLQAQNAMHLLHQQHLHQQQQHLQQLHNNRLEPLYESRLDDRNFVPDGMVPGLRTGSVRSREGSSMYPEGLDDSLHFNTQRIASHRSLDQAYAGVASIYPQSVVRNGNVPLQQPQYRGGPSPISHQQNILPSSQQQRLPPGLANLGGRPPHEPSQFLGLGMPSHGHLGGIYVNGSQQSFNNFSPGASPGFGGPPLRATQQMQNSGGLPSLGHLNNMEVRSVGQGHFPGVSGPGGVRNAAAAGTGFPGQQLPPNQLTNSLAGMRQQHTGQPLPSHMVPHLLPHMQQQHGVLGPSNQPAQDLMALLMGGSHRE